MAYGYPEFPSSNMHDVDYHELLCMYDKLTKEYSGLVQDIVNLNTKLNGYIQQVNSVIPAQVHNAVQAEVFNINSRITALNNKLAALSQKHDADIIAERQARIAGDDELVRQMQQCYQEVLAWRNLVQSQIDAIMPQVDAKIADLRFFVITHDGRLLNLFEDRMDTMQEQIDALPTHVGTVYNPLYGTLNSASKTIKDLWNYAVNWNGFTAREWQLTTYVTCEYWNENGLNAVDWWTHGKQLLMYYEDRFRVWDFVRGEWVPMQTAIYELSNAVKVGAITAGDYDAKKIPASTYDMKNLKAFCYDNYGEELLKDV